MPRRTSPTLALVLLCAGVLAAGCSASPRLSSALPSPHPPPGAAALPPPGTTAAPSQQPAVRGLAVADPAPASPPAMPDARPARNDGGHGDDRGDHHGVGHPAGHGAERGEDHDDGRDRARPRRSPEPERPATVCDLGLHYAGWSPGSSQEATCRAVYG
ncbi:hypothetical protein [Streptacidiphilus sp. EB129]|uniref:hypothetical protein n=1 Tax=Streptacidiphilus sp. EB129 TaxID=3156262 RepID=UPI0035144474